MQGGASVAPASIFVHLCGLTKKDGNYIPPAFDVKRVSTPCAIFSYLVHIIRDFQKDHLNNLNYFPDDLIAKYGMNRQQTAIYGQRRTNYRWIPKDGSRTLRSCRHLSRKKHTGMIEEIRPFLEPRCQLSLEIIFALYLMVFERIDIEHGTFTAAELNPTPEEIKERVGQVIERFEVV